MIGQETIEGIARTLGVSVEQVHEYMAELDAINVAADGTIEIPDTDIQASQRMAVAVEVNEDGVWRTTLHPSETAARHFETHTEHETRRVER